jgi:hypothetical protein
VCHLPHDRQQTRVLVSVTIEYGGPSLPSNIILSIYIASTSTMHTATLHNRAVLCEHRRATLKTRARSTFTYQPIGKENIDPSISLLCGAFKSKCNTKDKFKIHKQHQHAPVKSSSDGKALMTSWSPSRTVNRATGLKFMR